MCRSCAIKITVKDLLICAAVVGFAYFLYCMAGYMWNESMNRAVCTFLLVGFPFGVRKMFVWIIPFGHDIAATAMIWLLNVLAGALIGCAVLGCRVITTAFKTVYRVIRIAFYRPTPCAAHYKAVH